MTENKLESYGSISFQVVLRGPATLRPVAVNLNSGFPWNEGGVNWPNESPTEKCDSETNPDGKESPAKYACPHCGSAEVRGDFDTYQVYMAEGDKLFHLRSEFTDPAILALYCNECGERIEIENLEDVMIE